VGQIQGEKERLRLTRRPSSASAAAIAAAAAFAIPLPVVPLLAAAPEPAAPAALELLLKSLGAKRVELNRLAATGAAWPASSAAELHWSPGRGNELRRGREKW